MRKIVASFIFLCLLVITLVAFVFAQSALQVIINSHGTIVSNPDEPVGKLHIGQESSGENPSFFYDAVGKLVTLRLGHAWGYSSWWQASTVDPSKSWSDLDIQLMRNTSRNAMRIHLMVKDYFLTSADTPNAQMWSNLRSTFTKMRDNGIYFLVDWYQYSPDHPSDYWMWKEWREYSLFWNSTVQNDLVKVLNYTVNQVKAAGAYDHLIALNPSNEVMWDQNNPGEFPLDGMAAHRHAPVSLGGTGAGLTSVASDSWHNWLASKYNNNLNKVQEVWGGPSSDEGLNYDGTENSFATIKLSKTWDTNRQKDFERWYQDSVINYTKNIVQPLKSWHPDLYVEWDVGGEEPLNAYTAGPSKIGPHVYNTIVYGDIIDYHTYGALDSTSQNYLYGDSYQYSNWQSLSAFGRAVKKPVIVTETGVLGAAGSGDTNYTRIKDSWKIAISLAISNGIAGVCPWYIESFHGRRTTWSDMTWKVSYQSEWNNLMSTYREAESNIDKIKYDKITLVIPWLEQTYRPSTKLYLASLRQAGYNPKYVVYEVSNSTLFPNIPSDTEVIVLAGGDYRSHKQSDNMLNQINTFLGAGKKLLLTGFRNGDFYEKSKYWENSLDTSYFPLRSMTYGTDYSTQYNSANVNLVVNGQSVLIRRSYPWFGNEYVGWADSSISGTKLISTTDGDPWVIANSHVAWISALYQESQGWNVGATSAYNEAVPNTYLIFKQILSFWNMPPISSVEDIPKNVEHTYVYLGAQKGVLYLKSVNTVGQYTTIATRINLQTAGLDSQLTYVITFMSNSTQVVMSGSSLNNADLIINVPTCWIEKVTIQAQT